MSRGRTRMPKERQVREHWPQYGPGCFACGVEGPCERAHILAVVDGGDNSVDNLHMLCPICHKVSEFHSGKTYWEWINHWTAEDRWHLRALMLGVPSVSKGLSADEAKSLAQKVNLPTVSERTKEALAERKAQGVRLGAPSKIPLELKERIEGLRSSGMTLQAIADLLTEEKVPTPRNKTRWYPSSVAQALNSLALDREAAG